MQTVRLNNPYPKQRDFYLSRARYTAYGGARGGGKSDVARGKAILLCLRYAGLQVLFLRRTYPELKENHLIPALGLLGGAAKYTAVDKAFSFPNGARLKFGYCRNETDVLQYQGQAYDVVFMEECTQFPEFVMQAMTEINRTSPTLQEAFRPRMYFTCNPGGVGHAWFKRLFIDRDYRENERADDYLFIQATVYDNPALLRKSPDYVRALENLPDDRKRAMLHGDWDVFEGQYFPEFRRETHVCAPFPIPQHWARYRVFDYGFDLFAAYFVAVSDEGRYYFYKEIAEGRDKADAYGNAGTGLLIGEAAEKLLSCTAAGEHITATFAPPDMWNARQDTGQSAADIFAAAGVPLVKAGNRRVQGWYAVKEKLKTGADGKPQLLIFDCCTYLIRCMGLVLHDEKDPNDVAREPHEVSHGPDAVRYFVAGQPFAAPPARDKDEDEPMDFEEELSDVLDY